MHHLCVHCISSQSGRTGTQQAAQSALENIAVEAVYDGGDGSRSKQQM